MKIEIEELVSTKLTGDFVDSESQSGMSGGDIHITLNNGSSFDSSIQKFVYKMIHRTFGKGFNKSIKKYEENN